MKMFDKILMFVFVFIFVLAFCILPFTSCTSATSSGGDKIIDTAKTILLNDEASGEFCGNATYYAYLAMKDNPKYAKETAACEKLYADLIAAKNNSGAVEVGTINNVAFSVLKTALITKYGYVKGAMIADALNIISRRIIDKKLNGNSGGDVNAFVSGFVKAIEYNVNNAPKIEKEFTEDCINCDVCERIKKELARDDLTPEERAEFEKMLKEYECAE